MRSGPAWLATTILRWRASARRWPRSPTAATPPCLPPGSRSRRPDPEGIRPAGTLAGTQAGGVRATFGSMTKHLHFGRAALNGLLAGVWAQAGVTAGADTLEHPLGFVAAAAGPAPPGAWAAGE